MASICCQRKGASSSRRAAAAHDHQVALRDHLDALAVVAISPIPSRRMRRSCHTPSRRMRQTMFVVPLEYEKTEPGGCTSGLPAANAPTSKRPSDGDSIGITSEAAPST